MITIENWNIPIYNALRAYSDSRPIPFHMPGHKLGKGLPEGFFEKVLMLDVTEIPGTDNLHFPEGAIGEAQKLAAKAFGADETFFLVNGSTGGIHAAIMTICKPGDKLIVGRDCHKSVINGMMLAGVRPVYITPTFNNRFGISSAILPSDVEEALRQNPDAAGVLLTRPNYYGICSDIEAISEIVHAYDRILAVDEAHGAHLAFNDDLPVSAMSAGADICIQSAHKTLPALTQSSYLHVRGKKIDRERLRFYLRTLQSSSPSYIIMSSLDIARAVMEKKGRELLGRLKEHIGEFKDILAAARRLESFGQAYMEHGEVDWTRIVVNFIGLGRSGFDIDKILRSDYNIQVEMADPFNIVCISTIADSREDIIKLGRALVEIDKKISENPVLTDTYIKPPDIPAMRVELKDTMGATGVKITLKEAAGKVCMEMITPYPPGIPVVCPGEVISEEVIEYIFNIVNSGGTVNGLGHNYEVTVVK